MKLFLDNIIFNLQKSGGVSVVWFEHLKRVISDTTIDEKYFIEYQHSENNIFRKLLQIPIASILKKTNKLLLIRRYLNPTVSCSRKFVFHSSYYRICTNKKAINVTTVHDFTYEKYRSGISKWIHCKQKYFAIRNSEYVVCISQNTRDDVYKYLPGVDRSKIRVIYNGVSNDYSVQKEEVPFDFIFDRHSYIIFVGSREQYKRFDLVVQTLKDMDFELLIVGGGELSIDEIAFLNQNLSESRYIHVGSISNNELNTFYNNAFCLLYPSEYEGFGIPVVEAQKAGCPVIAYNGSSVKEIAIGSALLFNYHSVIEVKKQIAKLQNNEMRSEIIQKGLINSARFSWDRTYEEYRQLYEKIYNY